MAGISGQSGTFGRDVGNLFWIWEMWLGFGKFAADLRCLAAIVGLGGGGTKANARLTTD